MDDKTRLAKGQILIQAIVEIAGAPKEYVEESMLKVVDNMKEKDWLHIVSEEVAEAEAREDGEHTKDAKSPKSPALFSTYADVEVWVKSFDHLIEFVFFYMPATIEILEPQQFNLKRSEASHLITEIAGKLHAGEAVIKELRARNQVIDHNTRMIIQNFIYRMLEVAPRNANNIAAITGIPQQNINAYLDIMTKDQKIVEKNGVFSPAPLSKKNTPVIPASLPKGAQKSKKNLKKNSKK